MTPLGHLESRRFVLFSSPVHLKDLARRLDLRAGAPWPRRFQVLVHATANLTVALGFAYETHRVVAGNDTPEQKAGTP
jgi:hypothetical protein